MGVTGPTFTLNGVPVDGLGRLTDANETITKTNGSTIAHALVYQYDMLSQLTDANISNIDGDNWVAHYSYKKNGDMISRTINGSTETFGYTGHLMTDADGITLTYDENGNMKNRPSSATKELKYNWENKLRYGKSGPLKTIKLIKYDPAGNRIYKEKNNSKRKYIVDIVGDLPVILLELDPDNNDSIEKMYIYANSQIIAQHDGNDTDLRYFYLHDRLGSVRQMIDTSGNVQNRYTFEPFGKMFSSEKEETISNPFKFTGQYYDHEIDEYYLRARQYDPVIHRFTSRDPVFGKAKQPGTLHVYLYCLNDPVNRTDPSGQILIALPITIGIRGEITSRQLVGAGIAMAFAWRVIMANEVRNVLTDALIHMAYDWPPREFPWKDKSNIERLIHEHEQRASGSRPPNDPWGKIIYYLGIILEHFLKD